MAARTPRAAAPAGVDVVRRLAVGDEVDALDLVLLLEPEADGVLDGQADDQRDHARETDSGERTERLVTQRGSAAAVEQAVDPASTFRGGEDADQDGADDAADQVDADHVARVVVAELVLQPDRPGADTTGDGADRDGTFRVDRAAMRA